MSKPKVLVFDIETFPNVGYTWGKWEQNVIKFVKEWELASFAWRWQGETQIHCLSRRTVSEMVLVQKLHELFSEADILIAHNGDSFDIKKSRTKFLQFNLDPVRPNKSVDTKKIAKSRFAFNSNSLNDLAEYLGLGKKVGTGGFDLWLGCMRNDRASWALMEKYNKQDVELLEKVYDKIKAWAISHPNLALMDGRPGCPTCGSDKVQARGTAVTAKTVQQRYHCQGCGHWFTCKLEKKKC